MLLATLQIAFCLTSCKEDIDESNMYSFTGETIEDYLANRPEKFSNFSYILNRIGYDAILSSYGTYTCLAPDNKALEAYIDSLYEDVEAEIPHNGMTEKSLVGLTDSLCEDIALFHLLYTKVMSVGMSKGGYFTTILRRDVNTSIDSLGRVTLNNFAHLTDTIDVELQNGVVHEIDQVIPRSNNMLSNELGKHPEYSIFCEALEKTGLSDSLLVNRRDGFDSSTGPNRTDNNNSNIYVPTECKVGFTIFAETDEVLNAAGINSFEDLVAYANKQYGDCAKEGTGWYDHYRNNNINVSTGSDYKNPNNALNMFVRYHLVNGNISSSDLVYYGEDYAKSQGSPAMNYFETFLPQTLMRISYENGDKVINRWTNNSTLTDTPLEIGSAAMHAILDKGVTITNATKPISAFNGMIYSLDAPLVYKESVPRGVLKERLRFDITALFPELLSNRFRHMSTDELKNLGNGVSDKQMGIPVGYFTNMIAYNGTDSKVRYMPTEMDGDHARWFSWEADEINVQGKYDIAIKLPPVPDGSYEIRLGYQAIGGTGTGNRGMMQIFLGNGTNDQNQMTPLDIPLDMRHRPAKNSDGTPDAITGWCQYTLTDDDGVESDYSMHNLGYMRAPLGMLIMGGGNARVDNRTIRRVLAKVTMKQGEYWLRFKSVLEDTGPMLHLDYIELVPEDVYNNSQYSEDMF